jgi:hypothetical protein
MDQIKDKTLHSPREKFQIDNRLGAVSNSSTDTIITSITASNDDDLLSFDFNEVAVAEVGVQQTLGVAVENVHSLVDPSSIPVLDLKVARLCGADCKDQGVIAVFDLFDVGVRDFYTAAELDTFGCQEIDAALNDSLFQFGPWNTVHKLEHHGDVTIRGSQNDEAMRTSHHTTHQTASSVRTFIYHARMTCPIQGLCGGQSSWTGTNDSNLLAGAMGWDLWDDPTHLKGFIDDSTFDRLNGNWLLCNTQSTRRLAWCWTAVEQRNAVSPTDG